MSRPLCLAIVLAVSALGRAPAAEARGNGRAVDAKADQQAREHVRKGADAFREGRYDAAMAEFEAGYAAVQRPGFILNMGHVQRAAGNLPRARGYYRQYLDLEPGSPQRADVEKTIAEIDAAVREVARAGSGRPGGEPAAPPRTAQPRRPIALATTMDDTEVPADLKLSASESVRKRDDPAPRRDDGSHFYQQWWFWGTAGGVVVAGALAFVFLRPHADYTSSGTWGTLGK